MPDINRMLKAAMILLTIGAVAFVASLAASLIVEQIWPSICFVTSDYYWSDLSTAGQLGMRCLQGALFILVPTVVALYLKIAYDFTESATTK